MAGAQNQKAVAVAAHGAGGAGGRVSAQPQVTALQITLEITVKRLPGRRAADPDDPVWGQRWL